MDIVLQKCGANYTVVMRPLTEPCVTYGVMINAECTYSENRHTKSDAPLR